jgi:hypothetical protein
MRCYRPLPTQRQIDRKRSEKFVNRFNKPKKNCTRYTVIWNDNFTFVIYKIYLPNEKSNNYNTFSNLGTLQAFMLKEIKSNKKILSQQRNYILSLKDRNL